MKERTECLDVARRGISREAGHLSGVHTKECEDIERVLEEVLMIG
jgi:hypothetical protein